MTRHPNRCRRGAAAVEAAILLPFVVFLAAIAVDWARLLYYTITLDNVARGGALAACDKEAWLKSPQNPTQTAYPAAFPGTAAQQAVLTNAALAEAPNLDRTPTVTAASLADGGDGSPAVVVTATLPFTTFTNYTYGKLFGVEHTRTLTRRVQMRIAPEAPQ